MCLGGNNIAGVEQKPFGGKVDYDYVMWIDSDIVFTPEHFFKLLEHDKDIVSGLYMMNDNTHYATVEDWDDNHFIEKGHFQFLDREMVQAKEGKLFKADYTGFGWMLTKKGVFESLEYPWFQPMWTEYNIDGKLIRDFTMEDVAFCQMIKQKGFDVWIDPNIIVGHEKMMVL
jgi:GT2 family glycosyltransferase